MPVDSNGNFFMPHKIIRVDGDADTDFAGLWVETKQIGTWVEYSVLSETTYWSDIHEQLAYYVVAWNVPGTVLIEEAVEPVVIDGLEITPARTRKLPKQQILPPPGEGGADVFLAIPVPVKEWIRAAVISSFFRRDAPSDPTPEPVAVPVKRRKAKAAA